jgi:hypothetical protein
MTSDKKKCKSGREAIVESTRAKKLIENVKFNAKKK